MSKDFGTLGFEQTRYAPQNPIVHPHVRIRSGRIDQSKPVRFVKTEGTIVAGPGERIQKTDTPGVVKLVPITGEGKVSNRKTMESSRSQCASVGSSAKRAKFVNANRDVDNTLDTPPVRPIVNPGPKRASSKWSYQCRRMVR